MEFGSTFDKACSIARSFAAVLDQQKKISCQSKVEVRSVSTRVVVITYQSVLCRTGTRVEEKTTSRCVSEVVIFELQALKKIEGETQFNGVADCIRKTLTMEGPQAFFKGGLCRMIVIAPLFGIAQMVYFLGVAETLLGVKQVKT
ncbi:hypothetical protein pipiens_017592 [Culex pipiens pipiens]|uniref:Gustatory receptor n=1 Tax=Culex pipiens pipiens TaxID=38569 RepID=A0ABD1CFU0_CULPP